MDMTQVIFADLNTPHCVFMQVCLHQTVTKQQGFPCQYGTYCGLCQVFFYSALTEWEGNWGFRQLLNEHKHTVTGTQMEWKWRITQGYLVFFLFVFFRLHKIPARVWKNQSKWIWFLSVTPQLQCENLWGFSHMKEVEPFKSVSLYVSLSVRFLLWSRVHFIYCLLL